MSATDDAKASDLFTIKGVAKLLGRTEYAVWYHASRNLSPIQRGKHLLLTRSDIQVLVERHLRLKDGEVREELKKKVQLATAA